MAVQLDGPEGMRKGETIRAHLLYPVYADDQLLLPEGTEMLGCVVELKPDRPRRIKARLGGDFTPFEIPQIKFTQIETSSGPAVSIETNLAIDGAPVYRAVAPKAHSGNIVSREFKSGLAAVRRDFAYFLAPGRSDRLLQFLYSNLPYHPQRIERGTTWSIETMAPVSIPEGVNLSVVAPPTETKPKHFWEAPKVPPTIAETGSWIIEANLEDAISSETSKPGEPIHAVVAEPVYGPNHQIAVPEGARLIGTVTRAKRARSFGRTGVLSFNFTQLLLPNSEKQTVETRLTGADSAENIALTSEGQAKSKPQDKISIPLLLGLMAGRPLDQDNGGAGATNMGAKDSVAGAAGLGLVGTILGVAGGSPYAAAGIGYWGAARAIYGRWIAHGQKISFAKDTRIEVETTPRHSTPMRPNPLP